MQMFKFGSSSQGKYRCLGWNIEHKQDSILVSQEDYILNKIELLDIPRGKYLDHSKLEGEDIKKTRAMIGKLRWLADQCRPDIAFTQLELSMASHSPTFATVKLINKTVNHLRNRPLKIKFSAIRPEKQWYLTVFTDSSLGNLPNEQSAMGFIVFLGEGYRHGKRNNCSILTWKSRKTSRRCDSTYDAESVALAKGLEEAIFIKKQLITMLGTSPDSITIEAYCDAKDTVASVKSNKPLISSRGRLTSLEIGRIQELKELGEWSDLHWICSAEQLADSLTKRGACTEHLCVTLEDGRFYY